MVRLRVLVRHLRLHGCRVLREGGRHTIWYDPRTEAAAAVPRHRELPLTTARAICAQVGVPPVA